ncbi:hypothetical protein F2Q70_00003908 [Brassica cretica]|uniref:Uncharacterized protein n=1 Tax=Brassica cretica TaxID=69181 RepID=A0A8S9J2M9_BRACR|nr:hypothetical protein F2Q70_00003908 [Brassica cretica]
MARLGMHQHSINNLQNRMHVIGVDKEILENQWTRGDEAIRSFIGLGTFWRKVMILGSFRAFGVQNWSAELHRCVRCLDMDGDLPTIERAVEEMKEPRSTVHPWCRSMVIPEHGPKTADSRTVRKSTTEASIDTLQAAAIDSVNQASNDTIHPVSDNTVHCGAVRLDTVHLGTVYPDTVYSDTVHPAKHNTTCEETEKVEDISYSTLMSTDESSCYLASNVAKEITMEYFLELEEFLELENGENLEYWDTDKEITMEDFLDLEEWFDPEQKLDDERNTMRKDLETSSKASIDRHQHDEIV